MEILTFSYIIIEIALFIFSIVLLAQKKVIFGITLFIGIWVYPWVYECLLFLIYRTFFACRRKPYLNPSKDLSLRKSNIVYDPRYNIKLCGVEKKHPFDSCKYERVLQFLETDHQLHFQVNKGPLSTLNNRHASEPAQFR
jgi:hypothetical protein